MSSWMESGRPRLGLALRGPAEAAAIEPLLFGYLTALPRVTAEDGVVNLVLCVPPNRPGVARVDIALIDSSANDQTRELTQVLAEVGRGDWPGRACGLSPRVAEVVALTTRPEQRGPTVAPVRSCARPTTTPGRTSCRPGCLPSGVVQRGRPAAGGWGSPTIGRSVRSWPTYPQSRDPGITETSPRTTSTLRTVPIASPGGLMGRPRRPSRRRPSCPPSDAVAQRWTRLVSQRKA